MARDYGTAKAFADRKLVEDGRLFAKTGTAIPNYSIKKTYSSGFVGWLNPSSSTGVHDRLAFACRVTWTHSYGAGACGPIILKLLEEFDANPADLHLSRQ